MTQIRPYFLPLTAVKGLFSQTLAQFRSKLLKQVGLSYKTQYYNYYSFVCAATVNEELNIVRLGLSNSRANKKTNQCRCPHPC